MPAFTAIRCFLTMFVLLVDEEGWCLHLSESELEVVVRVVQVHDEFST